MAPLLRASVFVASTLVCLASHAEVRRNCITALEAQPATTPQKPTTSPKKPCPVAIAYSPDRADRASQSRAVVRDPAFARIAAPAGDRV